MLSKRQRQHLIRGVVASSRVGTQEGLALALRELGCDVTQATISRDLRELGVERKRDERDGFRYVLGTAEDRRDPELACSRMLEEFSTGVLTARNIVLVKSEPGTASGMGLVIDELGHPDILGCVAGDDTVLVVTTDDAAARAVADHFIELGG